MFELSVHTAGQSPQYDPPELAELPFVVRVADDDSTNERQYPARDPFDALSQLVEVLRNASAPCRGAWGVHPGWPESIALPVRYRSGFVGESWRVEHRVTLVPGQWHDENVIAACGTKLPIPQVEIINQFTTAPCPRCVSSIRLPEDRS